MWTPGMCREEEWPSLLEMVWKIADSNTAPLEASHLDEGASLPSASTPNPFWTAQHPFSS